MRGILGTKQGRKRRMKSGNKVNGLLKLLMRSRPIKIGNQSDSMNARNEEKRSVGLLPSNKRASHIFQKALNTTYKTTQNSLRRKPN